MCACVYLACIQKGKSVDLVDIPGDERVRDRLFSKYKKSLRYELHTQLWRKFSIWVLSVNRLGLASFPGHVGCGLGMRLG